MSGQWIRALPRRRVLAGGLRLACGAAGAALLTGCDSLGPGARPDLRGAAADLSVCLLGGDVGGELEGLTDPLKRTLASLRSSVRGLGQITFSAVNATLQWFPSPNSVYLTNTEPAARIDDTTIPMPDVVVAASEMFPDYLAARALDLTGYLRTAVDQDVPATAVRQGLHYATGRGTGQFGLPLMRIPLLCLLAPGIRATDKTLPTLDSGDVRGHAGRSGGRLPAAGCPHALDRLRLRGARDGGRR